MFSRQRAILRLVENEGGKISRLRLVKLAFLLSREPLGPRANVYEFVPYKRGPFSFTLYHELRSLERDGWLALQDEHNVEATHLATLETAFLDTPLLDRIDDISNRYRSVDTSTLIDDVYRAYPWFTLNSETLHKRAATRPTVSPAVYTVGYEGLMVDGLLDLLIRNGIRRLIDVRCNPIARRYGFHKSTIAKLCGNLDIEYVHFASLGIPSAWRLDLSDRASYERLFGRYEKEVLPRQHDSIKHVIELLTTKPSALMCMEADHHCCHRSRLATDIAARTSLPVKELRVQS
jgi:uncharacterized protein (DUF488 family)